jgi:hypothetical protein
MRLRLQRTCRVQFVPEREGVFGAKLKRRVLPEDIRPPRGVIYEHQGTLDRKRLSMPLQDPGDRRCSDEKPPASSSSPERTQREPAGPNYCRRAGEDASTVDNTIRVAAAARGTARLARLLR